MVLFLILLKFKVNSVFSNIFLDLKELLLIKSVIKFLNITLKKRGTQFMKNAGW